MAIKMKSAKTANESPKEAPKKASSTGASTVAKKKAPQKKEGTEKAAERKRQAEAKDAMVPVMDEFSSATKKKPESESKAKERASREKEDANLERPTGMDKHAASIFHDTKVENAKARRKAKNATDPVAQNGIVGQWAKSELKLRKERIESELNEVLAYAESFAQKSRYKDKDPKKVIYGIFLGFPEHPTTETEIAEFL